jgi:hypothetical protein
VVGVTDPYGRILDFLDLSRYFFLSICTHEPEWTPLQTHNINKIMSIRIVQIKLQEHIYALPPNVTDISRN